MNTEILKVYKFLFFIWNVWFEIKLSGRFVSLIINFNLLLPTIILAFNKIKLFYKNSEFSKMIE